MNMLQRVELDQAEYGRLKEWEKQRNEGCDGKCALHECICPVGGWLIEHSMGKDEWWCNWFKCPNCDELHIAEGFNYCPDCGVQLKWPNDTSTIKGYE